VKGIIGGAFGLIVLQVLVTSKGTEQSGKLATWVVGGLHKALSPEVAAIPYIAKAPPAKAAKPAPTPGTAGTLPRNPIVTV
jgi:hypothetical protein